MEFGVKLPNLSRLASRESILRTGAKAEELGFDAVWASDHVVFSPSTVHDEPDRRFPVAFSTPAVDPVLSLAMVAAVTQRLRLGTSVLILANRNPVVMAKAWASLDLMAPGRVVAGVGTGWQEREYQALGAGDRFRRRGSVTEEFVQILRTCWTDPSAGHSGDFYSFDPLYFEPRPARPIPVLLAGRSERGLRRVARTGDGFHGTNLTPPAARTTIDEIRRLAEAADRDSAKLEFTTLCELDLFDGQACGDADGGVHLVGPPERIAERVAEFRAAGITHLALRVRALSGSTDKRVEPAISLERGLDQLDRFAEEVFPLLGA